MSGAGTGGILHPFHPGDAQVYWTLAFPVRCVHQRLCIKEIIKKPGKVRLVIEIIKSGGGGGV